MKKARGKKISQANLAAKLNISRTSIVNIEAGRQRAPIHLLWDIAEILNTEVALLVPNRTEYEIEIEPITLDAEIITQIEEAANGDTFARKNLTSFITKVKNKSKVAP